MTVKIHNNKRIKKRWPGWKKRRKRDTDWLTYTQSRDETIRVASCRPSIVPLCTDRERKRNEWLFYDFYLPTVIKVATIVLHLVFHLHCYAPHSTQTHKILWKWTVKIPSHCVTFNCTWLINDLPLLLFFFFLLPFSHFLSLYSVIKSTLELLQHARQDDWLRRKNFYSR